MIEGDNDRSRAGRDWDAVWEWEQRLARGERLRLDDELRDLLRRVGEDVGLPSDYVTERLTSPDRAEELLREENTRIRDGSHNLSAAIVGASNYRRAGKLDEARSLLEAFIQKEPVPYYRELARRELAALDAGRD